jgi:glutathione synthase/RimK-type ligase-like ATP-grasp enzyme
MKPIAIHNGKSWNAKWAEYYDKNKIPHKVVCCYDSDILEQIRDCSGIMWHFNHLFPEDILMARNVLNSAEVMGLKACPNFNANWHFDDKLAQKYLFEALNLPAAKAWAFYDSNKALEFAEICDLPIVAKLRRGAGSYNVRLLKTHAEVKKYVGMMFTKGFSPSPAPLADARTKFKVAASNGGIYGLYRRLKKAPRFFQVVAKNKKFSSTEKGYVYFLEFYRNNTSDIRVSVVGNRAWAFQRLTRENDFRASGSGKLDYDSKKIPEQIIKQSFEATRKLKMQCICFDWVRASDGKYSFVEISYGFVDDCVYRCEGFWDSELKWHKGHFYPSIAIAKDFYKLCKSNQKNEQATLCGQDG